MICSFWNREREFRKYESDDGDIVVTGKYRTNVQPTPETKYLFYTNELHLSNACLDFQTKKRGGNWDLEKQKNTEVIGKRWVWRMSESDSRSEARI